MNEQIKQIRKGNIYKSKGENGNIYSTEGLCPTIKSGTGVVGNGIGSCNSPKILVYEHKDSRERNMGKSSN